MCLRTWSPSHIHVFFLSPPPVWALPTPCLSLSSSPRLSDCSSVYLPQPATLAFSLSSSRCLPCSSIILVYTHIDNNLSEVFLLPNVLLLLDMGSTSCVKRKESRPLKDLQTCLGLRNSRGETTEYEYNFTLLRYRARCSRSTAASKNQSAL